MNIEKRPEQLVMMTFHFREKSGLPPMRSGNLSFELAKDGMVPVTIGGEVVDAYASRTGMINVLEPDFVEQLKKAAGDREEVSHVDISIFPCDEEWTVINARQHFVKVNKGGVKVAYNDENTYDRRLTLSPQRAAPIIKKHWGFDILSMESVA